MKVNEINISRKFNLGNYQTMDVHVEASLDDGEDPKAALKRLEKVITDFWMDRTDHLADMAHGRDKGE